MSELDDILGLNKTRSFGLSADRHDPKAAPFGAYSPAELRYQWIDPTGNNASSLADIMLILDLTTKCWHCEEVVDPDALYKFEVNGVQAPFHRDCLQHVLKAQDDFGLIIRGLGA